MKLAGLGRTVRHKDHVMPEPIPPPRLPKGGVLDVRCWRRDGGGVPLLLVTASRRTGPAVDRNRFRRRVRMAFLEVVRDAQAQPDGLVLWVRPGRGRTCGYPLGYAEILSQLKRVLGPATEVHR